MAMAAEDRSAEPLDAGAVERRLRARLDQMTAEIGELTKPPEQGSGIAFGKRVGDGTTEAIARFTDVGVANDLDSIRARIERALEKLADGTYGSCDSCGAEIATGRLSAAPESVLCIECAAGRR
jgi:DnaK suppressor protein